MADIQPFPGVRSRPDRVSQVASPPYDVLNSEEARQIVAGNPLSFLRVVKAEVDLDPGVDVHSEAVYQKGAENLRKLLSDGVLIRDETPCFYIYQLRMGEHTQRGLMVGASVEEYESDAIKKHEHTRRDKEDDRARHMEILQANSGPVLLTYRGKATISEKINQLCTQFQPVYDFVADDGVGHTLWVVSAPGEIERLQEAFIQVDALYVADGHHRSASAYRVRNLMRKRNPHHSGDEPYNHFLAVLFPDDQLRIMGYHRVVRDLNGLNPEDFWTKVAEKFEVTHTDRAKPDDLHTFGCFLDGKWYRLVAKQGSFDPDDPVRSLDISVLQENLLGPVLGIGDPRTDERIDFVGGIRGTGELERRCAKDMRVAFALYPISVAHLMAVADSQRVMPPKSTWFEPKLRSGMVVRSLESR